MIDSVIEAIGQVTESALKLFSSTDFSDNGRYDAIDRLGTLVRVNHSLLDILGVSHHCLKRVCELVDGADIGWTKLTGAGGGGCAITLLRPDVNEGIVEELERKLIEEGFEKHEAMSGADGVGVLWPAIVRNGSHGEDEEIDEEKSESVIDTYGIEQLVGVRVREYHEGWNFWTRAD